MTQRKKRIGKRVETITHEGAKRRNIPTVEYQDFQLGGLDDCFEVSRFAGDARAGLDPSSMPARP